MKITILFLLLILSSTLYAQGYVTMSAVKTQKVKMHVSASAGYQFKALVAEAKMIVPMTNSNGYPAYFIANGGYVFYLSPAWQITPLVGYGYALESNDKKSLNKWVYTGSLRLVHNWLSIEGGVVDKSAFLGIGVIGFLNK